MTPTFDFYPEQNYAEVSFIGDINFGIIMTAFTTFINHSEFKKGMNLLLDFNKTDELFTQADMLKFFSFQEDLEDKRGRDYRVAVVCSDEERLSQLKILADYASAMPYEEMVFSCKDEALKWLLA